MKNVLLIILPYLQLSQESKAGYWGEKYAKKNVPSTKMKSWPALPYGALSIATYCKDVANIKVLDCNVDDDYRKSILLEMQSGPDIVGFAMTFDNSYQHLESILTLIRDVDPDIITVIGGAATVPVYKEILYEQENLDAVCFCDGEIPFWKLLESNNPIEYLQSDPSWITVQSLADKVIPQKTIVQNLDDVIEIDYGFVNIDNYSMREEFSPFTEEMEVQRRFFVVTSKGCCFRCSFCYRSRENDRKIRYASIDKVIGHVRYLVEHYGMTVLTLCDDQLLFNMKRAKELFRQLEQFHIRVEVMQGESVAFIDDEMACLMKKAGMVRAVLAIESGSQYILDKMVDKPVNLNKAKEVIKILRKYGFWVTAVFVMGFPGETDEHRAETLKWIQESDLDWSTFSAAVPIKGTKLYDMCIDGRYIKSDIKLGDMDFCNYFIHTPGYSPEYVTRQIYNMNLRCNFVENYSMRQGHYETASKVFRQVIKMYENHAFAWYYLSKCQWKSGLPEAACDSMDKFNEIIKKDSKWAEYAKEFGLNG